MTEFEQIVFGRSAIPALLITVIMLIAIPVGAFLWWRRTHKAQTKLGWLVAGAVGFLLSARVLELGVHYFCIVLDNPVSRFLNGNTAAFVVYGALMAGIFEECGRHIVLKYALKQDRTRENAVLYGIGHGGVEILAVLLPALISYLVIAVLFTQTDVKTALRSLQITEETASAALPAVQAAAAFDYGMMALNVVERLLTMLVHVGLTVIVYYGVVKEKKGCLPAAIALHALTDLFAALYQRGVAPLWSVEVWAALCTAVIWILAGRLYRTMRPQRDTQSAL